MTDETSRVARDLRTLPGVVGNMGVSIAQAQQLLNRSYLETVLAFIRIAKNTLNFSGTPAENAEILRTLLKDLAPPRYQFTETTIDFRAELFESTQALGEAGFSGGYGAFALNVSGAYGSQADYRAAARITSTLHAIPSSKEALTTLLGRLEETPMSKESSVEDIQALRAPDKALLGQLTEIRGALGENVKKLSDQLAQGGEA